ncbi:hypothetical protein GFS24_00220 [Chitinophaga sp. SYP-B3965]|uniref:DUF4397 domain-containing protein n=1 Tax=Chitinophaga sp. SYP-B3965 TaxID=2663120 RepID=UPI001299EBC3|nr:DUF4397 domain-containing protein [Chitinophaga sp. SYP-B3965]MRG43513.1 hypothetical protein [Chitinophaga sp. SYP-B3965]
MKPHLYIFAFTLVACNSLKEADSDITPDASINYFNAAEGITALPGTKAVYMDVMDTTQTDPVQFTDKTTAGETFPALTSTGPSGTVSILSMMQPSGTHRFIYTNGRKRILADTTFDLTAGGKHTFYAYDDADSLLYRCRILHIVENTSAGADECRFRLLHLSSDLGEMNCYYIKDDGTKVFPASLPSNIKYGNYSDLIKLDTAIVGEDGNAYLQFFTGTDTATVKATATIPYRNGRSYAVVVKGLVNQKFLAYEDAAGSVSVQLSAGILARVRIIN